MKGVGKREQRTTDPREREREREREYDEREDVTDRASPWSMC